MKYEKITLDDVTRLHILMESVGKQGPSPKTILSWNMGNVRSSIV